MSNTLQYYPKYPSVQDLKKKAKKRMPKFAFDYLEGGCNDELNVWCNEEDFKHILLMPRYLKKRKEVDMSVDLFGTTYRAPFGIAPVGLQGLMWPNAPDILAKAALKHNIPFILSTVSTSSIEQIAVLTESKFWFQLYHPKENSLRDDILRRLQDVECQVLVVLVDVPSFGLRYREIRAGLSMPPKHTLRNFIQAATRPIWALETLRAGMPSFATLKPYMRKGMDIKQLGKFMNDTFSGKVDADKVRAIRDLWPGKLVVKGVVSEEDAELCAQIGVDGIIISNHGGRQIDAGESTIQSLKRLVTHYKSKYKIMIDSGLRSGPDIARALACGADFAFMGRPFMYGVGALGNKGGDHTIAMLKAQLKQVMEQVCCERPEELPSCLIK